MNTIMMRVLALVFALGAVTVGYLGYTLSQKPPAPATAPPASAPVSSAQAVFAARDIPAGQPITDEDLVLGPVNTMPARAFASKDQVLGKVPWVTIASGELLLKPHFIHKSALARTVRAGERAVAVQVDEVIGTGGFIEPGDEVDVLLYLRADQETGEDSLAQVVLRKVRVLAFGNMLETPPEEGAKNGAVDPAQGKLTKAQNVKTDNEEPTGKKSKTAVLAIPEQDTTRLLLAESSGKLRLALHGAEVEGLTPAAPIVIASAAPATDNHYLILRQLVKRAAQPSTGPITRPVTKPTPRTLVSRPGTHQGHRVIVHKGDSVEVVNLASESHASVGADSDSSPAVSQHVGISKGAVSR